jgi:uncharacterized repeat protein (TIGR01451 family)
MMVAKSLRGLLAAACLVVSPAMFATSYNSNGVGGGNWNNSATWSPSGIPGPGDDVTIIGSDTVLVTDTQTATSVTLVSGNGSRTLRINTGGDLTLTGTGTALQINSSSDGLDLVEINGGTLTTSAGEVHLNSPGLSLARINFTTTPGILSIATDLTFSGTAINNQVQFVASSAGSIQLGGTLGAGGNISTGGSNSTFVLNGTGPQTINAYTFQNFTVNKTGTATLNGPITVNGDLSIVAGVLDDGGNQISLDGTGGSNVTIAGAGVLKLGSSVGATSFPNPVNPINVNLGSGSAVVYQSGAGGQSVNTSFSYKRLFLSTIAGPVVRSFVNQTFLKVLEEFNLGPNVTASFDNDILDVDGNITGSGTIQLFNSVVPGDVKIGGDWAATTSLTAANGTTVTYDGTANQSVLPATYSRLAINKASGLANTSGSVTVNNALDLISGNVNVSGSFFVDVLATVNYTSGHIVGPLTMGMNPSVARRFHVGTGTAYLPVDVEGGSAGFVTLEAVAGFHPNLTGTNALDKYWKIEAPTSAVPLNVLQFNYNAADVSGGAEAKYNLAQYVGPNWMQFGDVVNEGPHTASVTNVSGPVGDWVVGQRGTLGAAGKVAITAVNGGSDPSANVPFNVDVEVRHDDDSVATVSSNTTIDILLDTGTGSLLGASAGISAGNSVGTATNVTYDTAETGVVLKASSASGDPLDDGFSTPFNVVTASTLFVSTLADSGAGSLRDAITTVNAGGCPAPCFINFGSSGTGNIVLASPLPALNANAAQLTIDGFSGVGASANTQPFGSPSDAVITVSLDGNNVVSTGLEIQTSQVTIKGLGFRNFASGGFGEAIKINSGSSNTISGCYIGTDNGGVTGSANQNGIVISGVAATFNTIGGPSADMLNVISANTNYGIELFGGANNNSIKWNYIGVMSNATTGLGNGVGGIFIDPASTSNHIGDGFRGNIVSGHTGGPAIEIQGVMNDVKHNYIGLNGAGNAAIANDAGIVISGDDNYIGGIGNDRNFISGNTNTALEIFSNDNEVSNNYIGVDLAGTTAIANGGNGIALVGSAADNEIGDPSGNLIAHNNLAGIALNTTGVGNVMRQNLIYGNTGIPIDLEGDGATANDATDLDTGANNKQNFPIVSSVKLNGGNVDVKASIDSSQGVNVGGFLVDIYEADTAPTPGAVTHIGTSACIAGNAFTNQILSIPAGSLSVGDKIVVTATAYTDGTCTTPSEGTSELSPAAVVSGDIHWATGASGNWETAASWTPAVVPGPSDDVYIDAIGSYTVTMNASTSVNALHVGAASPGPQKLVIGSGVTFAISNPSDVLANGHLQLDGIGLTGNGSLTIDGVLDWNNGNISGVAGLTVSSSGIFSINTNLTKTLSQRLVTVNAGGTLNWISGDLLLSTGGAISNSGSFEILADWALNNSGGGGAVTNVAGGTIHKSASPGTTFFQGVQLNHNSGTLDVDTGTLDLASATLASTVDLAAGTELLINSDSVSLNGGIVSGSGTVHINGGTLSVDANETIPNTLFDSGVITGASTLTTGPTGTFTWNAGAMQGAGNTQIGGTLTLAGAGAKILSQRSLEIQSTATATQTGLGGLQLQSGGSVDNSGVFDFQADSGITNIGGGGSFLNQPSGTFRKSSGAGTFTIANTLFLNNGTVQVQSGNLDVATFNSGGSIALSGGTELLLNSDTATFTGGSVTGTGTLHLTTATMTVNGALGVSNLTMDSGTLDGTATLSVDNFIWNGGQMTGTGTTQIPVAKVMSLAGASPKNLSRPLAIASTATATMSGTGQLTLGSGGSVTNDGTFLVTADTNISGSGQTFTNNSLFRKNTGLGTLIISNVAFDNSGTLDVVSGIVDLAGGTSTGLFSIASTCEVLVNSDVYGLGTGSSVTGAGKLKLNGGTLNINGTVVQVDNFQQLGGFLGGSGQLQVMTNGDWGGGTMQGSGSTLINGSFSISGATPKFLDTRTFSTMPVSSVNLNGNGTITLLNGGNITNGGGFNDTADVTFANGGGAGAFDNTGTFVKQTTTGTTFFNNVAFTNHNIVDLQSGILSVTGAFSQPTGTLKLKFGGVTPGTQFAQLQTGSIPSFGGTLLVQFNGVYEPNPGDSFLAVSIPGGAYTGAFTPNYQAMCCGKTWSETSGGSGIVLSVNGVADLSISKTAPASVIVGSPLAYTLTVNNAGPDPATTISITDTLPAGHTGISASGSGWSCNVLSLTVTCTAATLPTGSAPSITINTTAPASPTTVNNTATVSASNDPNNTNDSGSATVTIAPASADLSVSASATPPGPVSTGTPVSFQFTIFNNGPSAATGVTFNASIPAGLTFVSSAPGGPTCTFSAGSLACTGLGPIASGNSIIVTVSTTTSAGGTQSVSGSAAAVEADPNALDNNATASVVVTAGATLTVTNANDSGSGSLRQAILDANGGICTAPCTINFNIAGGPPFVIAPVTELPALTANATIDATTQPGYAGSPLVVLDGANVRLNGFSLSTSGATIRGFAIGRFMNAGITATGNSNTIEGSWIGLNAAGLAAGNPTGILLNGNSNVIGGPTAAQRNVISGNTPSAGIKIEQTSSSNLIQGNYIGTNVTGTAAIGNAIGVLIMDEGDNNTIGGATAAHGNVISGNTGDGIEIAGSGGSVITRAPRAETAGSVDGTVIRNNRVGVNAGAGTSPVSNTTGIRINGNATLTTIDGNVIAGNNDNIYVTGPATSDTTIQKNIIGAGADGITPVTGGSPGFGIYVDTQTTNTLIGSTTAGLGNTIAHNQLDGIAVLGNATAQILGNSFFSNAGLAIDLENDGPTANDPGDADAGATGNPLQNFPTLTGAAITGATIRLDWNIDSSATATQSLHFEFYRTDGAGEGRDFIGSTCFAGKTFNSGASFPLGSIVLGDTIVGTATSYQDASCVTPLDGTSEFTTTPVVVTDCTPPSATITAPPAVCASSTGNAASVPVTAGATYLWSVTNGTITSGASTPAITFTAGLTGAVTLNVTVTSAIGCPNNGSTNVTITPPPAVTITGPTTSCPGAPITLDAGAGFSSYLWSPGGATTPTISVSPTTDTTYSVTVTNGTGCAATTTHTVTMNPVPAPAITGPTATCAGTPVTLDAGAGFSSYLWSPGGATTPAITVSPTSTTTYSVTVTNGSGCSGSDSHVVTVTSNPTATMLVPSAVCPNSTGNNASTPPQPGASYLWSITNGTITSSNTTSSIAFSAGASGSVTLSVAITVGACSSNGTQTIPIVPPPVANITGPTQSCPSTPFTLDAGGGFFSYLWSNGATTQTITVSQSAPSATYSVTVSNGACSATDTHTVTLIAGANVAISAPGSAQPGETGLTASVPADLLATFSWTISNGTITGPTNTNSITFNAGAAGTTTLTLNATKNGCTTIGTHTLTVGNPAVADISITKTAAASVTAGSNLAYTISVNNAGPDTAANAVITDTLPAGTSFVSVDGGPWTCFPVGSSVSCFGTAFVGLPTSIVLTVKAPSQAGTITNNVDISSTADDPTPSNNHASATTTVIGGATSCPTAPPVLLSPADGASIASPQTFSWSGVSGATQYELWIVTANLPSLAATTTSASATLQLTSGPASWFVVARTGGACESLRSAQRSFNVSTGPNCEGHGTPQMTSPSAGSTTGSPVTFSWTPVPQAIGYRVWIEVNGTAAQDIGTTNGAISLSSEIPPGSILAYVDALFSGCPAVRSPGIAFTVSRPDPCAARTAASPFAPANESTVNTSSVELKWSEAAHADGYRVWFSQNGGVPAVLGTTSETSLRATFAPGSINWWIEALYDGCSSIESTHFGFTIPQAQQCSSATPSLLAPQANATLSNGEVSFHWTQVPGAVSYELWLSAANGIPTLAGVTTSTSLTKVLPAGTYDWFVRVTTERCPSRDSQSTRFTIQATAACAARQRPIAISPIEGAVVSTPLTFAWSAPAGATTFDLFTIRGTAAPQLLASTTATQYTALDLETGSFRWFVRAHFNGCAPLDSEERLAQVVEDEGTCGALDAPVISAPGQISSGTPFLIQWTPIPGATAYQLQLANSANFSAAETITTSATQQQLTKSSNVFARVRAVNGNCLPIPKVSAFGPTSAIFILTPQSGEGSTPLTGSTITFTIPIAAQFAGQTFHVTTKEPWLTVTPASGVVGPNGTSLTAVANTVGLPTGTNLAAITLTLSTPSAGTVQSQGTTVTFPTLSVSLVTPVTPSPKSAPPPDALIIPAVAHADGINSKFQSDVRVSNTSPQLLKYQLTFTPSGGTGISAGKQTTFSIEPGRTIALDDILKSWFGTGTESAIGTLEIRPLTQTTTSTSSAALSGLSNLVTFAASRTFNLTSNGTFGQSIPAVPYANFIGRSTDLAKPAILSLQQIAQSDRYRTNLGIVEGSGDPASLLIRVFGNGGQKLTEFPVNLAGGEHQQLNAFLTQHGVSSLADGRVEIQVLSPGGKVSAYASVLDNQTSDPLLVTPVALTDGGNTHWVVPGVADLNNGFANWQTDMRVFNAGATPVDATLSFYSQGGGSPKTKSVTIPAGQVLQFDKSLSSIFGVTNDGGAVHITTTAPARLITTARTYNQTTGGTYGQFISAVTSAEAAGVGTRPLQILQVEESNRFRSNIGLAEVTGNPVKIEIGVVPPDAKFTTFTEVTLQPNEFRQIGSLLKNVGLDGTFNARVTIRAIEGTGRVTAYASVIDAQTNDPTYVPAQ